MDGERARREQLAEQAETARHRAEEAPAGSPDVEPGAQLHPATALALQQSSGNAAVLRLMRESAGPSERTLARWKFPWEDEEPAVPAAQTGVGDAAAKAAEEAKKLEERKARVLPLADLLDAAKTGIENEKMKISTPKAHLLAAYGSIMAIPDTDSSIHELETALHILELLDKKPEDVIAKTKGQWSVAIDSLEAARRSAESDSTDPKSGVTSGHVAQLADMKRHVEVSRDNLPSNPDEINYDLYHPVLSMLMATIPGAAASSVRGAFKSFQTGAIVLFSVKEDNAGKRRQAGAMIGLAANNLRLSVGEQPKGFEAPQPPQQPAPPGGQPGSNGQPAPPPGQPGTNPAPSPAPAGPGAVPPVGGA